MIGRLGPIAPGSTIVDVGCSTGYLLEDIATAAPGAALIGVDLIAAGLRKARAAVPDARLIRADACALPLADASVDAVATINLLEHIADDRAALMEIARVLRPGGRMVAVVPAGPGTFDYYDRFLGHERRYRRHELAGKVIQAGLLPLEDGYIGSLLYPAFWLVKRHNRLRHDGLRGDALTARVAADIGRTKDSRAGYLAWRLEDRLARFGVRLPFGIRSFVVACREDRAGR